MKNLSLAFKSALTKEEMRKIGGNGPGECYVPSPCRLYVRSLGHTYTGHCDFDTSVFECFCHVEVGGVDYYTDPNTHSMCEPNFN